MRSTKRRSKRSSCGLCKPQKQGWIPKDKPKYQAAERQSVVDLAGLEPARVTLQGRCSPN